MKLDRRARADWLDNWLAEGNSIENSEYYREKQDDVTAVRMTVTSSGARCPVNAYIVNRDHKRKVLRRFIVRRRGEDCFSVEHEWTYAPLFIRCSRRVCSDYGCSREWEALERMLLEEGRILPGSVYVRRGNNRWYGTSPGFKRYVKRWSNRAIRRYRGELARGRSAHRMTSRKYVNYLY